MNATCISCGMPLRSAADHALSDPTKLFCLHCATPAGELKSYDDVRAGMRDFLTRTQGIAPEVAFEMAGKMMAGMPAWRGAAKEPRR